MVLHFLTSHNQCFCTTWGNSQQFYLPPAHLSINGMSQPAFT